MKMDETKEREPSYAKKEAEQFSFDYEPIRGYPELRWTGKRPFRGTSYFPAQLKESHGDTVDGWRNKLYWGDNLQVMSHLLREYRGKVKLIYIDPPFDSKADYKKKIELKGKRVVGDASAFEEKQYTDIWTNDEYLQFMYERLILMRELLDDNGSIWVHLDWHKSHYMRLICDEVFGCENFINEVVWQRTDPHNDAKSKLGNIHDSILWYSKAKGRHLYNWKNVVTPLSDAALKEYSLVELDDGRIVDYDETLDGVGERFKLENATYKGTDQSRRFLWKGTKPSTNRVWVYKSVEEMDAALERGEIYLRNKEQGSTRCVKFYLKNSNGILLQSIWDECGRMKGGSDYPTRKPEALLERIILASSNPGDLVFDSFMGSGTTQVVALRLGRRFLGADINLGSIQLTTKRLHSVMMGENELEDDEAETDNEALFPKVSESNRKYPGFEVYTVNRYDFFRNELEAKELLIEALELQKLPGNMLWDGESDGWMVKILAVNRLATAADINPVIANLDYKAWEKRAKANPGKSVERIRFVCMGHDPDLRAQFLEEMDKLGFKVELEILDILRDKKELQFKRESEARISLTKKKLEIRSFYPMNLLQKLSLEKTKVGDWKELVDSVLIDWNYDGAVFSPGLIDIPEKGELVSGVYDRPEDSGTIRVKITDLIAESWEGNVGD